MRRSTTRVTTVAAPTRDQQRFEHLERGTAQDISQVRLVRVTELRPSASALLHWSVAVLADTLVLDPTSWQGLGVMGTTDAITRWRAAGEAGDASAAAESLSADVELISPLTEQFRFHGRDHVADLLSAAFTVIDSITFHTHVDGGDTHALFYRARIGKQPVEEAQLLRLDETGQIQQVTLFVRSLPALTALTAALGPALARRRGRPGLAAFLAASTAPLHAMAQFGERRIVPLAAPSSP